MPVDQLRRRTRRRRRRSPSRQRDDATLSSRRQPRIGSSGTQSTSSTMNWTRATAFRRAQQLCLDVFGTSWWTPSGSGVHVQPSMAEKGRTVCPLRWSHIWQLKQLYDAGMAMNSSKEHDVEWDPLGRKLRRFLPRLGMHCRVASTPKQLGNTNEESCPCARRWCTSPTHIRRWKSGTSTKGAFGSCRLQRGKVRLRRQADGDAAGGDPDGGR